YKVWKLEVRVIRLWTVSHFVNFGMKAPIEMVALDEKGDTIQCSIKGIFIPIFEGLLAEGNMYVVTNFAVALNTIKFKPTRHEFRIHFKRDTIVRLIQDSSVPLNEFNFVLFKKIQAESKEDGYLVGVMGVSNIKYNLKLFINVEFLVARNFFARYNIHIRVIDHTDAASFVLFDGEAAKFLGVSANDFRQSYGVEKNSCLEEINKLRDIKFIFKVQIKMRNLNSYEPYVIHVLRMTNENSLVSAFLDKHNPDSGLLSHENSELLNLSTGPYDTSK
ncbi:hypothetical protein S245_036773, partial [Arachis hypogaea]